MTKEDDLHWRHPTKLRVHTAPGYHKVPGLLDLHRMMMARFQAYGVK